MKFLKYIMSLIAVVSLSAACTTDLEQVQILPLDQVTAPVLEDLGFEEIVITSKNMGEKVSFAWSKADFGAQVVVSYSLAARNAGNEVLISSTGDLTMEVTYEAINSAMALAVKDGGLGLVPEIAADVELYIVAAVGNQRVESNAFTVSITPTSAEKVYPMISMPGSYQGWDPLGGFTRFEVLYDFEGKGVYEGIADFGASNDTARQWKFTNPDEDGDGNGWNNGEWGQDGDTVDPEAASLTLLSSGGGNITAYTAKRFYHFSMDTNSGELKHNYSFDQVGVVGAFTNWADGQDKVMEFNAAKRRFWVDIENFSGEFKFRTDGSWTKNWGGGAFGEEGDNLNCAEAGNYRVYLYLSNSAEMKYELNADMYGQTEPVGGQTPETPETPENPETPAEKEPNRWGLVGTITGWGEKPDFYMDEVGADLYVRRAVALTTTDEFKIRFNDEWNDAKNYGLETAGVVELNVGFAVITSGGSCNMMVPADGTYDIYFSLAEEKVWVMTEGQVPSDITLKSYKLYVDVTATGWENCNIWAWDSAANYSGGNWPGQALTLEDGKYVWTAPAEVTGKTISVIFNNGTSQTADITGVVMDKDHTFVLNADLSYTIDGEAPTPSEIKLTVDVTAPGWENCNIWAWDSDANYSGGNWPGQALTLEDGKYVWTAPAEAVGKTINVIFNNGTAQTADINGVVLDKDHHFVVNADLSYTMDGESKSIVLGEHTWGVAGEHNGWGDSAMTAEDGWVVAKDLALEAGKKFKIRADGAWAISYGHAEDGQNAKVGEVYELAFNGKDMLVETTGTYDVYFTIVDNVAKMKLIAK
ncbi:MAG: starch-binding protein [Alistipes sp.]|nr:starch-binding protein [Alistipes sp.]